jgi:O-antigen/teichoic acid export membrane protein
MVAIGIVSIFTFFGLLNSSLMSSLQYLLQTEFSIIANTVGKLLTLGMIVWIVQNGTGVEPFYKIVSVLLSGLAGNICMTALTWWYTQRRHRVHFGADWTYMKHILLMSLPYGLALFLNAIFFKVDTILLSVIEPHEIVDTVIALYALPMKIVEVGMMYGTVFLNSLLPVLTSAIKSGDTRTYQKLTRHALILLAIG